MAEAEVKSFGIRLYDDEISQIRRPFIWPSVILNLHCLLRFISVILLYFKYKKEAQSNQHTVEYAS